VTLTAEIRRYILDDGRVEIPVYVGSKPEGDNVTNWITLQQVAGFDLEDLSGREGTTKARLQVTCCTRDGDPESAQSMRDLVLQILYGFTGAMGSITVTGIFDAGSEYDYEEPKIQAFCSSRDFYVWYAR